MEFLSESDWIEFNELVESIGPLILIEDEIVFRGGGESITRDYVLKPVSDSRRIARMLESEPEMFHDAGFMTILPFAKSVEMHIRLLYLGENEASFRNRSFQLARCIESIKDWVKGGTDDLPSHTGFHKKVVQADGHLITRFMVKRRNRWKDMFRMLNLAHQIYGNGNSFRHNQIRDWNVVKANYHSQESLFEEFTSLFDELTR